MGITAPRSRSTCPRTHSAAPSVFEPQSGISSVSIIRKDGEQLLRVKLTAKLIHYAVNLGSGRLELSLVHE